MTEAPPDVDGVVDSISPVVLRERIDAGENVFLLDARSEGDFGEWHIDGENVDIVNYPYWPCLNA